MENELYLTDSDAERLFRDATLNGLTRLEEIRGFFEGNRVSSEEGMVNAAKIGRLDILRECYLRSEYPEDALEECFVVAHSMGHIEIERWCGERL